MRRLALSGLAATILVLLAGCLPPSPNDAKGLVHDLRILAIRLDPPEVVVPTSPTAPSSPVKITVLAASPRRGTVYLRLRGCELYDPTGCTTTAPDSAGFTAQSASSISIPAAPAVPSATYVETRALPADFLEGLMNDDPLKGLLGVRPVFEVRAQAHTQEIAFKRLGVSWSDSVYRLILAQAGIPVCDASGGPKGCIPWQTKTPNHNPVFTGLKVRYDDRTGPNGPFKALPTTGPLELKHGEQVTFRPSSAKGSAEKYQTLTVDLENRKVKITDRTELLEYSWYSTDGVFQFDTTEKSRTLGVDDGFQAPDPVPVNGGENVFMWVVLRDTRGGVDFRTVRIHVSQ